jgi:6,7-dimethyl-8-ribityllumazine synthase
MRVSCRIGSNRCEKPGTILKGYVGGMKSKTARHDLLHAALCHPNVLGMSTEFPAVADYTIPADARIAIAAARFNASIVDELLAGCLRRLVQLGVDEDRIDVHRVPGAFELPLAAKLLASTGRCRAVICLGAVIRGETPHFDYVAGECARGIQNVALSESLPIIFGVLTTNNEQQARDRIGGKHGHSGERAAEAALEMIALSELTADRGGSRKL